MIGLNIKMFILLLPITMSYFIIVYHKITYINYNDRVKYKDVYLIITYNYKLFYNSIKYTTIIL
jgi:hypothetical protein